jgi:acyl-CoA dehydrogenase
MIFAKQLRRNSNLFDGDHDIFRANVRRFVAEQIVPHREEWEGAGMVSRELWLKAGEAGLLCPTVPSDYGGPEADWLYNVIVLEEVAAAGFVGPGFFVHSEMATPYIVDFGSEMMKSLWLPRMVSGEAVSGIAMTEPSGGSDLRAMRTRAKRTDDGWKLSGQKVFISNGQLGDVFIIAAKTAETDRISLFLVPADRPGFERGKNLHKIGSKAQDTSELFFDEVPLTDDDVIGEVGEGFRYLLHGLARERLAICIGCQARAETAFEQTLEYVKERRAFGSRIADFQNTRFELARMSSDLSAGRALVDCMIRDYLAGTLTQEHAAEGKLWVTEMLNRVVDRCLQLHGGWGYMWEYPIARAWADSRVETIAGGTSEIMKEIIGRNIVGPEPKSNSKRKEA